MRQVQQHVLALRTALQGVELWADAPELMAALAERHAACLRAELWAATGRDSTWLSRPLVESQALQAVAAVRHQPELWGALCEAVPWLAAHAALRTMQQLRAGGG